MKPFNPFYTEVSIPDEYFCDRKKETQKLLDFLQNGSNIVLKSPRRIGKSSLILHLLSQPEVATSYNTLFVDVYGTKNMVEFIKEMQNAFLAASFTKTKKGKAEVLNLIRGAYLKMSLSPAGYPDGFQVGFAPGVDTAIPLQEMFQYLERTKKPNIVVFDEFQTINEYPEKAAAILRTNIQRLHNTKFIFSGSSRHLLDKMFQYPNEPFYRSAVSFDLGVISLDSYTAFCKEMFAKYRKSIEENAVKLVYELMSGNTYDMQEIMKQSFYDTKGTGRATVATVTAAVEDVISRRDSEFRNILNTLNNQKERNVLFCIATEGIASGMTSTQMINRYHLDNASSVQNALKSLCGESLNLVCRIGKASYMLRDRFFELWLAKRNQLFDNKLAQSSSRFLLETELRNNVE